MKYELMEMRGSISIKFIHIISISFASLLGGIHMLYPKQVKRFFKKTTGKNISSRGLIKLINHFESEMEEMVELCVQQHLELNEMKRFHGLYVKKRVDREAIVKAIEFINNKRDTPTKTNREVLENIGDIL